MHREHWQEPRAAYVHVPFCAHHCGYCNFTVAAGHDHLMPDYLDALRRELEQLRQPRIVDTLYVGGGSPTRLPPEMLAQLWRLLTCWFAPPEADPNRWECTVEANPGEFDFACARELTGFGVNRISLGVQSFQTDKLRRLDRQHTPDDVLAAVAAARSVPVSLGVDLIFAAPEETLSDWLDDLKQTVALQPNHISTYGLTFEKGTVFWNRKSRGHLHETAEELQRDMFLAAIDVLEAGGYEHYEVSNFAKPGHASRHNQVYWRGESYWGFGAGAARYVDGRREVNHRSMRTYIHRMLAGASPLMETECLDDEQRARERLVLGLRMRQGVDRDEFGELTGHDLAQLAEPHLAEFLKHRLIAWNGSRLALTREGLLVSDSLWPYFLSKSHDQGSQG